MKKLFYLLLPVALVLVLNGCSDDTPAVPQPAFNVMDDLTASADDESC